MRLLAILEDPEGPSARLRFHCYRSFLESAGMKVRVEALPPGWLARRRLLRSAALHDVVLVQRRLMSSVHVALLRRHSRRLLFDFDDALMLRDRPPFESATRRRRFRAWMRHADCLIAGSRVLKESVEALGAPAVWIPTVVPPGPARGRVRSQAVWVGQASTARYLRAILPDLALAFVARPAATLIVLGAGREELGAHSFLRRVSWTLEAERASLAESRVGLAPLPEDPWARSKCGARVLHYLAAGLPVIASPVGMQEELGRETDAITLAREPRDWREAVLRHLDAGAEELGRWDRAARDLHGRYTPQAWQESFLRALLGESERRSVAALARRR